VEATTLPYDIVEGIDECDFFELTKRQNALGLAYAQLHKCIGYIEIY